MSKYEQPLINGEQISKYEQQPRKQKRKFDDRQIHHINKILEDRQHRDKIEDAKITKRKRNYSPIRFDLDEENTKSSPQKKVLRRRKEGKEDLGFVIIRSVVFGLIATYIKFIPMTLTK